MGTELWTSTMKLSLILLSSLNAAPLLEQSVLAPNQQLMQQAALYSQSGTQQSVNFQQASHQQERVNKTGLDIIQDIIRTGLDTILPSNGQSISYGQSISAGPRPTNIRQQQATSASNNFGAQTAGTGRRSITSGQQSANWQQQNQQRQNQQGALTCNSLCNDLERRIEFLERQNEARGELLQTIVSSYARESQSFVATLNSAVLTMQSIPHYSAGDESRTSTIKNPVPQRPSTGNQRVTTVQNHKFTGVLSSRPNKGVLLVLSDGRWGTVCDDGFGVDEADTACRAMGYTRSVSFTNVNNAAGYYSPTGVQFAMDEVSCPRRNFMSLLDCNFDRQHNCARGEEMVLECVGGAVNGGAGFQVNTRPAVPVSQPQQIARPIGGQLANHKLVEVTSSRPNKGVLMVYYNGQWGTVCDDGFGQSEADVACRAMHYDAAATYANTRNSPGYSTPPGSDFMLDDVSCNSNEISLLDCQASRTIHNCGAGEEIVLECRSATKVPRA